MKGYVEIEKTTTTGSQRSMMYAKFREEDLRQYFEQNSWVDRDDPDWQMFFKKHPKMAVALVRGRAEIHICGDCGEPAAIGKNTLIKFPTLRRPENLHCYVCRAKKYGREFEKRSKRYIQALRNLRQKRIDWFNKGCVISKL